MAKFNPLKKTHVPKMRADIPKLRVRGRGKKGSSGAVIAKRGY